jgi:putative ABC transport system substrate-binding protein
LKRREFITLLGLGVAGWPLAARAQQSAMPVVGFLRNSSLEGSAHLLSSLRRGLSEAQYVEGQPYALNIAFQTIDSIAPADWVAHIVDRQRDAVFKMI